MCMCSCLVSEWNNLPCIHSLPNVYWMRDKKLFHEKQTQVHVFWSLTVKSWFFVFRLKESLLWSWNIHLFAITYFSYCMAQWTSGFNRVVRWLGGYFTQQTCECFEQPTCHMNFTAKQIWNLPSRHFVRHKNTMTKEKETLLLWWKITTNKNASSFSIKQQFLFYFLFY